MQQLTFNFNPEQVNLIIAALNELPQKLSRSLTDYIVNTANEQLTNQQTTENKEIK